MEEEEAATEEADSEEVAGACDLDKQGMLTWMRARMTIKNIRRLG